MGIRLLLDFLKSDSTTLLLIPLIKCRKGHKSLGSICSVAKFGQTEQGTDRQWLLLSCSGIWIANNQENQKKHIIFLYYFWTNQFNTHIFICGPQAVIFWSKLILTLTTYCSTQRLNQQQNNFPHKGPMQTFLWRPKMKDKLSISQKLLEITVFNIHPLRQAAVETFSWIWWRFWIGLAVDYSWMRLPVKDSSVIRHRSEFRSRWEDSILIASLPPGHICPQNQNFNQSFGCLIDWSVIFDKILLFILYFFTRQIVQQSSQIFVKCGRMCRQSTRAVLTQFDSGVI